MKEYTENERRQLEALRDAAARETPETPASLSRAAMEAHITAAKPKQKKNTRRILRYSLSAAAAVLVAFAVFIAQQAGVFSRMALRRAEQEVRELSRVRTAPNFSSYEELSDYLSRLAELDKKRAASSRGVFNGFSLYDKSASFDADMAAPEAAPESTAESAAATAEFGETNLRESGVDEADIVKTDGEYLYVLSGGAGKLSIVRADGGTLTLASSVSLHEAQDEEDPVIPRWQPWGYSSDGMFLTERCLIVTGMDYRENMTRVTVFDITDKTAPVQKNELLFKGTLQNARLVGGRLILVTNAWLDTEAIDPAQPITFLPYCKNGDTISCAAAEDIYLPENALPTCYINVYTADILADEPAVEVTGLLGSSEDIYCTADRLYVYGPAVEEETSDWYNWRQRTSVYALDLTGAKAAYLGRTTVDGTLLDTFSLDRYNGYLRLALTDVRYVNGERFSDCRVCVLDDSLQTVGVSERLADGETVRSVRFMGDVGYLVTFRNTDPLFVLDLSNPAAPAVMGEVKLPGFSAYLHPAGEGLLLGIGYGGTETGLDGSAKVSLFDVSDPAAPREINALVYPDSYLNTDYKSFVPMGENGWLVVKNNWSAADGREAAQLLRLTVENGQLTLRTVYTPGPTEGYPNGVRGTFIGDTVYMLRFLEREIETPTDAEPETSVTYEDDMIVDTLPVQITYVTEAQLTAFSMETGEILGSLGF